MKFKGYKRSRSGRRSHRSARRMGRPRHHSTKASTPARDTPRSYFTKVPPQPTACGHSPCHGPRSKDIICRYKTHGRAISCTAKAGMGHPRTARKAGRRRNSASPRRTSARRSPSREYNRTCREAVMEFTGVWGEPHAQDGLLGQHGRSVHHLRQQIHRDAVVAAEAALRQGPALQGLHHPALLAGRRNGPLDPRAEPAGLLPRREGHDLHGAVPGDPRRQEQKLFEGVEGDLLLPRLDHNAVDLPSTPRWPWAPRSNTCRSNAAIPIPTGRRRSSQ